MNMKRKFTLFALCALMLMLVLSACGGGAAESQPPQEDESPAVSQNAATTEAPDEPEETPEAPALPTVDPSGAAISIPENVDSVVVLAPSIAETMVALGLEDKIVGYDTQSIGLDGLPSDVPTFDIQNPDVEQLVALAPDVLLLSGLAFQGEETPYQPLLDAGICVICVPTSQSIDGVKSDIQFLAAAFGANEAGEKVLDDLNAELDRLAAITASIPEEERKTVYFEISAAPYMYSTGSGTYLDEMIQLAGGVNVLADQTSWISVEGESIVAANPDVIFTNVNYIDDPVGEILSRDGWAGVTAVANKAVYSVDNMASSLPNQNIVVALRQMVEALYPEYYNAA
jgi:iron complex transport system substrate-binding protein